jgi:ABC-2 type transport system ATP-binding protein
MTTVQLLKYMAQLKGIHNLREIEALLGEFDLEALRNRKLKQMSQGEKQRVAVTQAFLGSPAFLLLDEPLNYLDSLERKRVISMVRRYAARHLIIVATHELNEWSEQAERILWLDRGQVRFFNTPQQWLNHLPERVWVGTLSWQEIAEMQKKMPLHQERIIMLKVQGANAEIRLLSQHQPDARFIIVSPTIEDAYFIHLLQL